MRRRLSGYPGAADLVKSDIWPLLTFGCKIASETKDLSLEKIIGSYNPSDMLTKHVDRALLSKHMTPLGLYFEDGRAESAPTIT